MKNKKLNLGFVGVGLSLLTVIIMNCAVAINVDAINDKLGGGKFSTDQFKTVAEKSEKLAANIEEEGAVLLKNENDALPLKRNESGKIPVNVLGYTGSDNGNILRGIGSSSAPINKDNKVTLVKALENEGFEVNKDLLEVYKSFDDTDYMSGNVENREVLIEPSLEYYGTKLDESVSFSSTAIIVIGRILGENTGEAPLYQKKKDPSGANQTITDENLYYLELSTEERRLIVKAKSLYKKIIILINSTNNMNLSFLTDEGIDAALSIGVPGQAGMTGVAKILNGDVCPSGKLTDTVATELEQEASYNNFKATPSSDNLNQIAYKENIYIGYRWFETAYEENYFNSKYEDIVQYPFGYGLSYTNFDWKIMSCSPQKESALNSNSKIEMTVKVTNSGSVAGKDVVQLYAHLPYYKGKLEKSSIQLVDFKKTKELKPGESDEISLSFDLYDIASYDNYDKNKNGHTGWELDSGQYIFDLRTDVHNVKEMADASLTYTIASTINYNVDPTTNNIVKNRFTGDDAYDGIPMDGSTVNVDQDYLTRSDFVQPASLNSNTDKEEIEKGNSFSYYDSLKNSIGDWQITASKSNELYLATSENGTRLTYSQLSSLSTNLQYNWDLINEIGNDYNSPKLEALLNQMSVEEMCSLVEESGFQTRAIESIGKPLYLEYDGPTGLNSSAVSTELSKWTSFPSQTVLGQTWNATLANNMGKAVALEGNEAGIHGWYAPGVNLHRSSFSGRNFEYYSEDPILSGIMGGSVVEGAKSNGMHVYLKHFVMAEMGDNGRGTNEWGTEQALRELYLKPFEIAVKRYKASGIMSSFNRIGASWSGANNALLNEILRDEWGFEGAVITDFTNDGWHPMATTQGVVAGNDLWLCQEGKNEDKLDRTDTVYQYAARRSAKNTIYMIANTLSYAYNYDHNENDEFYLENLWKPVIDDSKIRPWAYAYIAINIVALAGIGTWAYFLIRKHKKKEDK